LRKKRTIPEVFFSSVDELQSDELEAALFETVDDVANEPSLDTVGLTR
jgi:hypothetical protein